MQFQQETRASIQNLTNQMGQMATQMNQTQSQNFDKLPSQTVKNLKNVSAITLRYDNQIQVPPLVAAPAPKPVKLHSTLEKEDEIATQKRKLPNKNFHSGGPSLNPGHISVIRISKCRLFVIEPEIPLSPFYFDKGI